ncbi:MAG: SBBP repeat-containing protein [Candidatus Glassbacteria bacterium]
MRKFQPVQRPGHISILLFTFCLLVATDLRGQVREQWIARYNGPSNGTDYAKEVAVDDSGYVFVAGWSNGIDSGDDYATIKYSPTGELMWVSRYNGVGNGDDHVTAMAMDADGNICVTGNSWNGTDLDYATVKYSSDGDELWTARHDGLGGGYDSAVAIAVDPDENVYVTGSSLGDTTSKDYTTIKYDCDGNELWSVTYNGPANKNDGAKAIAIDYNGNVCITGSSESDETGYDFVTVKYDSAGNELWTARRDGPGNGHDYAFDVIVDENGYVYVTGQTSNLSTDFLTVKYDPDGNELWSALYDGPASGFDGSFDICLDGDCNVFVTGESVGAGTLNDFAVVKYDSSGNELWTARYNGPDNVNDVAKALTIDSSGNVYVTGHSYGLATFYDYASVKYSPEGIELWAARYNGPGDDIDVAWDIAVDVSGNVYVTGRSDDFATSSDYATIKYRQGHPHQRVPVGNR